MAKVKFAFKPHKLQQDIIDHVQGTVKNEQGLAYRILLAVLGRQFGKSWVARYLLMDAAIVNSKTCMWIAPTIPTARQHWNELVKIIEASNLPVKKLSQAAKEIHFKGGGMIQIRSAIEPDNLRGASIDLLVLDEAAFFRNGEYVFWSVCVPMITASGGKILITTTPNGQNWLYKLFQDAEKDKTGYYKTWHFPSTASPIQDAKMLEMLKNTMSSRKWREEFMAEFLADGGGVFHRVDEAAVLDGYVEPLPDHTYIMGIDIGKNNDPTCVTVIDKYDRQQVYGERFTEMGTIATVKRVIELFDIWQPKTAYIEKNGVGEHLVSLIRAVMRGDTESTVMDLLNLETDETGSELIKGVRLQTVHMTNDKKRDAVERLAADIEYGRLKLLSPETKYGKVQISEMSTFVAKHTANNLSLTYQGINDGVHDDTISALYLAYMGVPKPKKWKMPKRAKDSSRKSFRNLKGKNLNARRNSVHTPNRFRT